MCIQINIDNVFILGTHEMHLRLLNINVCKLGGLYFFVFS